jgi:cell division protein FtsB
MMLEAQVANQERDNEGLQQRNDALAAEVKDLKEGQSAIEERARSELGMIKPGEKFYRVVDDAPVRPAQPPVQVPAQAGDHPADVP